MKGFDGNGGGGDGGGIGISPMSIGSHCGEHATPWTGPWVVELREKKRNRGLGLVLGWGKSPSAWGGGRAAPELFEVNLRSRRSGAMFNPLAVLDRRGLGEDGDKNGGDAEEGEGAEAHSALPHLMIEIGGPMDTLTRGKRDLRWRRFPNYVIAWPRVTGGR